MGDITHNALPGLPQGCSRYPYHWGRRSRRSAERRYRCAPKGSLSAAWFPLSPHSQSGASHMFRIKVVLALIVLASAIATAKVMAQDTSSHSTQDTSSHSTGTGTHLIDRLQAIRLLQESLKSNPNDAAAWAALGKLAHEVAQDLSSQRDAASSYIEGRKGELAASGFNPTVPADSPPTPPPSGRCGNQFGPGKPACRAIPVPGVPAVLRSRRPVLHLSAERRGLPFRQPGVLHVWNSAWRDHERGASAAIRALKGGRPVSSESVAN